MIKGGGFSRPPPGINLRAHARQTRRFRVHRRFVSTVWACERAGGEGGRRGRGRGGRRQTEEWGGKTRQRCQSDAAFDMLRRNDRAVHYFSLSLSHTHTGARTHARCTKFRSIIHAKLWHTEGTSSLSHGGLRCFEVLEGNERGETFCQLLS